MKKLRNNNILLERNAFLKECSSSSYGADMCFSTKFLQQLCEMYSIKLIKFVRLKLGLVKSLLNNPAVTNLHVVYLVRDPRSVMNSRWNREKTGWCWGVDCCSATQVCQDMEEDLNDALNLRKQHPGKIHIFRFEDIALDPQNKSKQLIENLGLEYSANIRNFVELHTSKNIPGYEETYRVSSTRVINWDAEMPKKKLKKVQIECKDTMKTFGYLLVNNTNKLTFKDVLANPVVIL